MYLFGQVLPDAALQGRVLLLLWNAVAASTAASSTVVSTTARQLQLRANRGQVRRGGADGRGPGVALLRGQAEALRGELVCAVRFVALLAKGRGDRVQLALELLRERRVTAAAAHC